MHLNAAWEDALDNIGTPVSDSEKKFLKYIIQHPWGWSTTPKQHRNANGFRYLNKLYPQLGGLRPILDNIVWPEEARYFPRSLGISDIYPMILFVSDSGYYFYKNDLILYEAGNTLEGVFDGLKYCKYLGPYGPDKTEWEGVDTCTDWFDPAKYFPNYKFGSEDPHWMLTREIPEPPELLETHK